MSKLFNLVSAVALSMMLMSCGSSDTADRPDTPDQPDGQSRSGTRQPTYVMMPESTAIAITLVDSIDTDEQKTGDEFRARLRQPVVIEGKTLFATGAETRGTLEKVVESGRLKTPAEVQFSLTAVQDVNGDWVDVETHAIYEKKGSHTGREVAMIGGGAIVGGIVGKVIDKKGSTEIGAAAGAAAGAGLAAATGKKDIFYGPGTEVLFLTSRSTQIAVK